ncbi:MAG TPA: hypothetical protein VH143_16155 [Kofleriaceae bacterium]|jgi:hypothetical protein|nr:hypothetical protein [Kofleriaceae bacterium]
MSFDTISTLELGSVIGGADTGQPPHVTTAGRLGGGPSNQGPIAYKLQCRPGQGLEGANGPVAPGDVIPQKDVVCRPGSGPNTGHALKDGSDWNILATHR